MRAILRALQALRHLEGDSTAGLDDPLYDKLLTVWGFQDSLLQSYRLIFLASEAVLLSIAVGLAANEGRGVLVAVLVGSGVSVGVAVGTAVKVGVGVGVGSGGGSGVISEEQRPHTNREASRPPHPTTTLPLRPDLQIRPISRAVLSRIF